VGVHSELFPACSLLCGAVEENGGLDVVGAQEVVAIDGRHREVLEQRLAHLFKGVGEGGVGLAEGTTGCC